MHLVFATSIVPCGAPETGYEIANAAVLGALARAGVRVTVMGFAWPGKQPAGPHETVLLGHVDVTTEGAPALRKVGWAATALASGLTFASAKLRVTGEREVAKALQSIGPFDGIILNSVQIAGAFEELLTSRPFAYVAHNVEHRSARENAAAASGRLARHMFEREAELLAALEARLCRKARFVYTFAEEDAAALGLAGTGRTAVLPLVTRAAIPDATAPRTPQYDAVLIGTWTWAPNRIGLDWFLNGVVPLLPEDFSIAIAGRAPDGLADAHPRVRFAGRVEDAAAFMCDGKVVPLVSRAGTGVQLKTIEAFELGLPCVATSHALRGVAERPSNCAVADDAESFARTLVEARDTSWPRLDGTAFHAAQKAALDANLKLGLAALGEDRAGAAA